ncbi:hypothetical protein RX327_24265 [Bradyrhizobium sp. BEA-2-5]|nr:hypothetical protein [Bradyrhizobium sp. BEA-2-5]WOH79019.1 hypothetical protein RX327_24265 [Bradyrhizobium sp. BEA-2-5]
MIEPPPFLPSFTNKDLIGAAILDDVDARLSSAFDVSPHFPQARMGSR